MPGSNDVSAPRQVSRHWIKFKDDVVMLLAPFEGAFQGSFSSYLANLPRGSADKDMGM